MGKDSGPWVWIAISMVVGTGCGNDGGVGAGSAETCAGTYSGSYSGAASGTLTGNLSTNGAIEVTFTESGSTAGISGSGTLGPGGRITLDLSGNSVTGALDANCHAGGTWSYPGFGSGTWQMSRLSR